MDLLCQKKGECHVERNVHLVCGDFHTLSVCLTVNYAHMPEIPQAPNGVLSVRSMDCESDDAYAVRIP